MPRGRAEAPYLSSTVWLLFGAFFDSSWCFSMLPSIVVIHNYALPYLCSLSTPPEKIDQTPLGNLKTFSGGVLQTGEISSAQLPLRETCIKPPCYEYRILVVWSKVGSVGFSWVIENVMK